jgi:hydroxymethylpyrimidine/phosphomethylpyrimidine kinase
MHHHEIPIGLTIAGSDSGGGAGIQADLKTFQAFGVFGTSAVTAITAQNTMGVQAIHTVPLPDVRAQIDAVVSDMRPAVVKTGMLATSALVVEVAEALRVHGLAPYVMDPVMVATSGDRLLASDAVEALKRELLPLATVVTPNLEEAGILSGETVEDLEGMRAAAHAIVALGASSVLVKGGHLGGDPVDLFWDGAEEHVWRRARIDTRHTHGTGCTLSAAVAAGLARGRGLRSSVESALDFVARAIADAPGIGQGHGPVNHFVSAD